MTVTFTLDAMKPRPRLTKSGKPAKPRKTAPERPSITVQSRGEEVLVWIDCRSKWSQERREKSRALRDLAIRLLGPLTLNNEAGGYYNLIATGPRLAEPGEKRRAAMLRVVSTLRIATRKTHTHVFKAFKPTSAELGPLTEDALKSARREWALDLATIMRFENQDALKIRAEKQLERERRKREREEKRAAKAAKTATRKAAA